MNETRKREVGYMPTREQMIKTIVKAVYDLEDGLLYAIYRLIIRTY